MAHDIKGQPEHKKPPPEILIEELDPVHVKIKRKESQGVKYDGSQVHDVDPQEKNIESDRHVIIAVHRRIGEKEIKQVKADQKEIKYKIKFPYPV